MKTPTGRYTKAQIDLDRWLTRLLRASKEVDRLRKLIKYYERRHDANRGGIPTRVRAPKLNVWNDTAHKKGLADQ